MKITEGRSKKFIAILISLLVIGGMLAKTKSVAADQKTLRVIPFDIQISGTGAVEWTNVSKNSGSYSVKLSAAPSSLASVGINAYTGTINNLTSLSFYYQHHPYADGVGPRMFLFFQKDDDYYLATTHCVVTSNDWKKANAVTGGSDDFFIDEGKGIWDYFPVDDTGLDQIGPRTEYLTFAELQGALTGANVLFAGVYVQAGAEEGPGGAYVDDIEINGITYYGMIQDAVDTAADNDTIYVSPSTYNEEVVVSKQLFFATDPGETVDVTSFDLRNTVNISDNSGAFSVETVYVKTGKSYPPGGGIGDALNFVKDSGKVEVEGKEKEETCQNNHWEGGLTINKSLTLKSSSDTAGEEVCLTDENNPAITITGGTVTIENFILFNSAVGVKAEGGQTTIRNSVIVNNTHGIITSGSAKVDAAYNWWGEKSGPYNKTKNPQGKGNDISDNVVFCPFYKNKERTDLDRSLCPPPPSPSSPANPSPRPPSCDDQPPFGTPDLFQIDTTANSATLYFAPASMPYNKYFVAYGYSEGDERFGVEFNQGFSPGVIAYTIYCLSPNATYYFKVRPGNGCMPGAWGNTMKATTTLGNKVSQYYRYFPSATLTTTTKAKATNQTTKVSLTPALKPTPTVTVTPTAKASPSQPAPTDNPASQAPAKKRCFLFWCW